MNFKYNGRLIAVMLLLSGSSTSVLTWYMIMMAIWGAPTSPLQGIALIGSVIQIIAAILLACRFRFAVPVIAIGLVLTWVYYLPLLIISAPNLLSALFSQPLMILPFCFLITATYFCLRIQKSAISISEIQT